LGGTTQLQLALQESYVLPVDACVHLCVSVLQRYLGLGVGAGDVGAGVGPTCGHAAKAEPNASVNTATGVAPETSIVPFFQFAPNSFTKKQFKKAGK
jgi:hypothetical protein